MQISAKCDISQGDIVYIVKSSDLIKEGFEENTTKKCMDFNSITNSPIGHVQVINQYTVNLVLKENCKNSTNNSFFINEYYCVIKIMSGIYQRIFSMLESFEIG